MDDNLRTHFHREEKFIFFFSVMLKDTHSLCTTFRIRSLEIEAELKGVHYSKYNTFHNTICKPLHLSVIQLYVAVTAQNGSYAVL